MADESTDTSTTDAPTTESAPAAPAPTPTPAVKTVDATGGDTKPEQRTDGEKTFTQADLNRFLQDRLERDRVKMAADVETKVRQEMAEAKLFEDKEFEKLAELNAQKATQAEARLAEYERLQKVDALLDKKAVLDPELRSLFRAVPGDLTLLDAHIESYRSAFDAAVQKSVSERLDTKAPPQSATETETKKPSEMTIEEWAAHKKANNIY